MSKDELFERFKPIRNKLRQFDATSIITRTIKELHTIDPLSPDKWKGALPWNLLVLIRWTFQFGDVRLAQAFIPNKDWTEVYNAIYELDSGISVSGQGERDTMMAFMGRTLFTQLQHQTFNYEVRGVGRQLLLFEDLGNQFDLDARFKGLYGLTIRDFLSLHYTCWAIKADTYSYQTFRGIFSEAVIEAFFRALSVDLAGGQAFIRDWTKPAIGIQFQLHEQSPLDQKPFFRIGSSWIPFSHRLLGASLQENLYDLLKRDVPRFSAEIFGPMFEQYLTKTIDYYCDDNYDSEKTLKGKLPKGSKAADFVIYDTDATVFVEAKGTELNARAQVYQSQDSIIRNTSDTTLKAVIQCQTTACQLLRAGHLSHSETFALIVTFKEHLFGAGDQFWNDVIGTYVEAALAEKELDVVIPPSHLFFLTVADFDWLLAGSKQRGQQVSAVLREIVLRNQAAETRAFMLRQHLEKMWETHYEPPLVETARQGFQDQMMKCAKSLARPNTDPSAWRRRLMQSAIFL